MAAPRRRLLALLRAPATDAGLEITSQFNLGESEHDFRVPDGGLHRPGAGGMWHPSAALVIEIVSPGDESWQKLPFYAKHNVDEVLIVDPAERTVTWLVLREGEYRPIHSSGLIELGTTELAKQIDWPYERGLADVSAWRSADEALDGRARVRRGRVQSWRRSYTWLGPSAPAPRLGRARSSAGRPPRPRRSTSRAEPRRRRRQTRCSRSAL